MANKNQITAIEIFPYDNEAPAMFEEIKRFLYDVIPFHIEVEHVGSTAVHGLGGKGVIDVLIVTRQDYMEKAVESLESKGYKFNPEAGFSTFPERLFISGPYKYNDRELHVHFHITFSGSSTHKDMLVFRDYLRTHSEEAKTYYELKKQWSIEAGSDRRKYTELKIPYISEVLKKAKKRLEISATAYNNGHTARYARDFVCPQPLGKI